jgi:hypothetical protein
MGGTRNGGSPFFSRLARFFSITLTHSSAHPSPPCTPLHAPSFT